MARLFNLLQIKWIFQPQSFDLGGQRYTPDFYLPEFDLLIEVKNFLSEYSRNRDERFRRIYPDKKLILLLKNDYLKLQGQFAKYITEWEYS